MNGSLLSVVPQCQIKKRKRPPVPYSALDVHCPMCGAYSGKRCRSSKKKLLRYPHFQRVALAAERFRATARLQILNQIRRHQFTRAFPERRLAVEGFSISKFYGQELKGPRPHWGGRGAAPEGHCDARS